MWDELEEEGLSQKGGKKPCRSFVGLNYVIYCDNFSSGGPLVDMLAKDAISIAGTIKKHAKGFLECAKPPKSIYIHVHVCTYVAQTVDNKWYFIVGDCSEAC